MRGSGVDASIHTLENLYDIKLNYYVRQFHILPQVDLLGNRCGKWPGILSSFMAVPFPSWVHLNSGPRFCCWRRYSSKVATMTVGKTKKKVVRYYQSWPLLRFGSNYNEIIGKPPRFCPNQHAVADYDELDQYPATDQVALEVTSQAITWSRTHRLTILCHAGYNLYVVELDPSQSLTKAKEPFKK